MYNLLRKVIGIRFPIALSFKNLILKEIEHSQTLDGFGCLFLSVMVVHKC